VTKIGSGPLPTWARRWCPQKHSWDLAARTRPPRPPRRHRHHHCCDPHQVYFGERHAPSLHNSRCDHPYSGRSLVRRGRARKSAGQDSSKGRATGRRMQRALAWERVRLSPISLMRSPILDTPCACVHRDVITQTERGQGTLGVAHARARAHAHTITTD